MLDSYKTLIVNQFEAALSTLKACIDECPDETWCAPVADLAFCQVAFHALFFVDCYLCPDSDAIKEQDFHRENPDIFRNYDEMSPNIQTLLYEKPDVLKYLEFCRQKVREVIPAETQESLDARCGFYWLEISRAELHVYNIRHVQHHAAALSLRLRLDNSAQIKWQKSAWCEK